MADTSKLEGLLEDLKDEKDELQKKIEWATREIRLMNTAISNMRDPDKGPYTVTRDGIMMPDDPSSQTIKREKQEIQKMKEFMKKMERKIDDLTGEKDKVNKHIVGTMDAIRRAKSF